MEVETTEAPMLRERKLIAFTPEKPVTEEAQKIEALLQGGFYRVHLRHPGASTEEIRSVLERLTPQSRESIVLHDHFDLATEYHICGLHLNSRNPLPPEGYTDSLSRSCHSVEEVLNADPYLSYVTLSPIFDSISKTGYRSGFQDTDSLSKALASAQVPVIALGGIGPGKLPELNLFSFSGYAMLGAIPWSSTPQDIELFANKTVKLLPIK